MKWTLLLCLSLLITDVSLAQDKSYNTWMFSTLEPTNKSKSGIGISFVDGERITFEFDAPYNLSYGTAAISDPLSGELLFYTNGCEITNLNHEMMENGDEINPGVSADFCDFFNHNSYRENFIILPDNYVENAFYLIYRDRYQENPAYRDLKYCYIDMNANDGFGKVMLKNQIIFEGKDLEPYVFNATLHANGMDWYLINMAWPQDSQMHLSIIDENGPRFLASQNIETNLNGTGEGKFSPDGSQFICYQTFGGLSMYDFDVVTGRFLNHRYYDIETLPLVGVTGFVAISPAGKYAYVGNLKEIFQVNLATDEVIKVAEVNPDIGSIQDQTFGHAVTGQDCKIYISPAYESKFFHVINNPDEPFNKIDFQQNAFSIPIIKENGALPNFPNYAFADPSYCESITAIKESEITNKVEISPNPSTGLIQIKTQNFTKGAIYHIDGRFIFDFKISSTEQELNLNSLDAGIYLIVLSNDVGYSENKKVVLFK